MRSRSSILVGVAAALALSGCSSLEPLEETATPASVPFSADDPVEASAADDETAAAPELAAPPATGETDDEPAAEPEPEVVDATPEPEPEPEPAPEPEAPSVDTSGIALVDALPTAGDLGVNWIPSAADMGQLRALSGEGACAVPFADGAVETLDGDAVLTTSAQNVFLQRVAVRHASADAASEVYERVVGRDVVSCDGDPNAIVYAERRGGADVWVSWSTGTFDGGEAPIEVGVALIRQDALVVTGMVVAEPGVHDVESILWAFADTAVGRIGG